MDVSFLPLRAEADLSAWPHGIIGQSYDGDATPLNGRRDDYSSPEVFTVAMAEGAIEGSASDYAVAEPYETRFKFSRFDATMATSHPRPMARQMPETEVRLPPAVASATEEWK